MLPAQMISFYLARHFLDLNNFILQDVIVLDKIQFATLLFVKESIRKCKESQIFKVYFCKAISKLKIMENEQTSYKKRG